MERQFQGGGATDTLVEHDMGYSQATSNILENNSCKFHQKDTSRSKMVIDSETWKPSTASRTHQTVARQIRLITSANSAVAGGPVSTPNENNDNANLSIIDMEEDKNLLNQQKTRVLPP